MRQLHLSEMHGWDYLSSRHIAVLPVFLLYALPLSLIPPLMLYYVGTHYNIAYATLLKGNLLQMISVLFFLAEQVMLMLMAAAIQRIGETLLGGAMGEFEPSYEDSFKLAAVAATPLWLAPLFLFIPSLVVNLVVMPLAMIASSVLIFQGVPAIFRIEEKNRAALFSTAIVFAGIVGWATMIYVVVFTLSVVTPF